MQKKVSKSASEIQDEIFAKMSGEKKIKLASDFSMFLLSLNKSNKKNGFSKSVSQNFSYPKRA
ncbi:MAG: hypothetical protein UV67_C0025G0011 [Parcubacteria group bacterium GW2011_GWC1_43_12]|nr:MAG: hypothetical protein UV34_C0018G0011 [Parcubacteria group bacterium GW2011_GWB1_42_6]KKS91547.1 MAG: hypothetical protein UV67_C0025G0011 [Parcubacteria group bacterium GW2011_GWC1_43_12]